MSHPPSQELPAGDDGEKSQGADEVPPGQNKCPWMDETATDLKVLVHTASTDDHTMPELDDQQYLKRLRAVAELGNKTLEERKQHLATVQGDDEEATNFAKMLLEGTQDGVTSNSALGQRLKRCMSTEEKELYKDLKGHAAKSRWRKEWAERKYKEVTEHKQQLDSWEVEDVSDGVYCSMAKICEFEGGDAAAAQAARKYILKCSLLGGRWLMYNDFTERYDYLYVQKTRRERFSHKWSLFKQSQSLQTEATVGAQGTPQKVVAIVAPPAAGMQDKKRPAEVGDTATLEKPGLCDPTSGP